MDERGLFIIGTGGNSGWNGRQPRCLCEGATCGVLHRNGASIDVAGTCFETREREREETNSEKVRGSLVTDFS
jgi:hypothetical protein